jgi:hypothetical protein
MLLREMTLSPCGVILRINAEAKDRRGVARTSKKRRRKFWRQRLTLIRWWGRFLPLVLLTLAVLLSIERNGNTQSKPSPEKRETPAALPAHGANQNNQSALYAALIGALHAVTEQEKAAAKQSRAQNETLIAPPAVQEGLLVVGFLYSFLAWLQWKEISKQAKIANQSLALQFRPKLIIRNVVVDPPYPKQVQDAATAVFRAGYPVVGQLYVANVGRTAGDNGERLLGKMDGRLVAHEKAV